MVLGWSHRTIVVQGCPRKKGHEHERGSDLSRTRSPGCSPTLEG
ncbi:hypothetical protein FM117_08480 [Micrococcus luteus Mu201]|nr:hypothetical protein FM117_08480 [Micrococcus luteus Mu201]